MIKQRWNPEACIICPNCKEKTMPKPKSKNITAVQCSNCDYILEIKQYGRPKTHTQIRTK